ncbi:MAG: DUF1559 domain-containing protein, partial [Planctomycetaceae bacterium]|nr:DUF1559 domain-containing protein [Planctomycetaceae bacterium]
FRRTVFCAALVLCSAVRVHGQDKQTLPDDLGQLIEMKTGLLEQYSQVSKSGPADKAIDVLRQIVNIHRKAVQVAEANQESEEIQSQLRNVYANDTEFLADQLFERREFSEAASLRNELYEYYRDALGNEHQSSQQMRWQAMLADKLSKAPRGRQVAYMVALGSKPQAVEALQKGEADVAEQIYLQLINAEVAVLGETHPNVAVDLNEYGRTLWMQQKYSEAESAYQRSLKAREASTGKDLQYATTTFNLGRVYQDTQRYTDAEKMYLQTASIEEPVLGSRNESFLQTLQQLASLYDIMGDKARRDSIQQRIASADPLATVLSHLSKNTYAAAAIRPSSLRDDPDLVLLPFEIAEAAGQQAMGLSPFDVEAVVAFTTLPMSDPLINFGFLFKLKDGVDAPYPWRQEGKSEVVEFGDGQQYFRSTSENSGKCAAEFTDGTVLVGTEEAVRQCLNRAGGGTVGNLLLADQELGQIISAADIRLVRGFVVAGLQQTPPLPAELEPLKSVPNDVDTARLRLNVGDGIRLSLNLDTTNADAARRTAETLNTTIDFGIQAGMQQLEAEIGTADPVQAATAAYVRRIGDSYLSRLRPTVNESTVTIEAQLDHASVIAPTAVALLIPAIGAAHEAAERTKDKNSLKLIGLAMHNFHETHGRFPARANYGAGGEPLLSWRVHLLPFLDESDLYNQFRLNEPWDSEHNLPLSEQMPAIYRCSELKDASRTVILTADGPGTMMEGNNGIPINAVTDGTSNTIMVLEANADRAVVWTKPDDLPFDPQDPANGLGTIRSVGFQAAMADGSVRLIPFDIDAETLKNLIQRNDGQPISDF